MHAPPVRLLPAAALAALALAAVSHADVFGPTGTERRVNTVTSLDQSTPSVAHAGTGRFVVVWSGYGPSDGLEIWGQRFTDAGAPSGAAFRVNTYTTDDQVEAHVAALPGGAFVVVWRSAFEDGDASGLFGQLFDGAGAPNGAAFRVNTVTTLEQHNVAIGSAADGFVVVWESNTGVASLDVLGRRFTAAGTALDAAAFRVNVTTTGSQIFPAVAPGPSGFLIVWRGLASGVEAVFARRFAASGAPLGAEFIVDSPAPATGIPAAAYGPGGGFVVAWASYVGGGSYIDVLGRRFSAEGTPLGAAFRVNTFTAGPQTYPSVSAAPSPDTFVVAWQSFQDDGTSIHAQRFLGVGPPLGGEFRVNTYTTGFQGLSLGLSSNGPGDFVVAWTSQWQDGSGLGAFLQRFCHALAGDADANDAINVSDVLYLINHLFAGGPPPLRNSDANGDLSLNVSDILYLINYLFAGGPPPACPVLIG